MKIGIIGCAGRMGQTLVQEVSKNQQTKLSGGAVLDNSGLVGKDVGTLANLDPVGIEAVSDLEVLFQQSDAVIDFSCPETSISCSKLAKKHRKIHIIGTTGFSEEQRKQLSEHSKETVIVSAYNMSIGVNLLSMLTEQVAQLLDEQYDIEIVEMHHNKKVDAPSGTALMLGEAAATGRNTPLEKVACKSRDGQIGARPQGEIGFSTLRGGDVVGDHTVIFAGDGERIELTHKASSRKIFAKGAVRAALWSKNQPNGIYTMRQVLKG